MTFLHHDQLGSTRLITSTSGANVGSYRFDPYGTQTAKTGTATTPLGYAGQYTDAESGLIYMRARYYDPATGTFTSPDPIGSLGSGQNLYGYVGGDPVNFLDPSGLFLTSFRQSLADNWGHIAAYATAGACVVMSLGACIGVVAGVAAIRLFYRFRQYQTGEICGDDALKGAAYDVGYSTVAALPGIGATKVLGKVSAGSKMPKGLEYVAVGQWGPVVDVGAGPLGKKLGVEPGLGDV